MGSQGARSRTTCITPLALVWTTRPIYPHRAYQVSWIRCYCFADLPLPLATSSGILLDEPYLKVMRSHFRKLLTRGLIAVTEERLSPLRYQFTSNCTPLSMHYWADWANAKMVKPIITLVLPIHSHTHSTQRRVGLHAKRFT